MKKALLILLLAISHISLTQSIYFSKTEGDWDHPGTWSSSSASDITVTSVPGPNDRVVIRHKVTLNRATPYIHQSDIYIREYTTSTGTTNGHLIINTQFIFSGVNPEVAPQTKMPLTVDPKCRLEINAPGIENAFIIQPLAGETLPVVNNYGNIIIRNGNASSSILNKGQLNVVQGILNTSGSITNAAMIVIQPYGAVEVGSAGNDPLSADFNALSPSSTLVNGELVVGDDIIVDGTTATICRGAAHWYARIVIGAAPEQPGGSGSTIDFINGAQPEQLCPELTIIRDPNALPIEILTFNIINNSLVWDVFEERISGYEIQFSDNTKNWETVGSIESKGDGRNRYQYPILRSGYYRLKVISIEEVAYSSIVYYEGTEDISFFPNFINPGNPIYFKGDKLIEKVSIYNTSGTLLKEAILENGVLKIDQASGLYFISIKGKNLRKVQKLIVR